MKKNKLVVNAVLHGIRLLVLLILTLQPIQAQEAVEVVPQNGGAVEEAIQPGETPEDTIGQGAAQSAMSGTGSAEAGNTGSTTGGQPIANSFNFQTDLFTGRLPTPCRLP